MKKHDWRLLILEASRKANKGNYKRLNLLAKYLEETDRAKQLLRNKGYGWTGLGILETIQTEVPCNERRGEIDE